MPVVSVILPTCDRPHLIGRALRSVLAQTGVNFEVVLVDSNRQGGPVADNPDLAVELADPRVRLVRPEPRPQNASEARNAGLEAARGDWITYLDDDDEYLPDKVRRQFALAESTGAPLVICGYEVVMRARRRRRQCHQDLYTGDECLVGADYPTPVIFHRAVADLRFDPRALAAQDHLFAIDLLALHRHFAVPCVPEVLLRMHTHDGPRVNLGNRHSVGLESRLCLKRNGRYFSREARRAHLAIGLLARAEGMNASWPEYLRCLRWVARTRGWRGWRLIVNALARRSAWLRRWVVT